MKDTLFIVMVCAALGFVQPRSGDIKIGMDDGSRSQDDFTRKNSIDWSYKQGGNAPGTFTYSGTTPYSSRLVNSDRGRRNSNNPYYSSAAGSQYTPWQISP
jgi:hypothetical protein